MRSGSLTTLINIKLVSLLLFCMPILSMDMGEERDIKSKRRQEYWQAKKLLEPMGYVIERPDNQSQGEFRISFPPIRRTKREIEDLKAWGFTDDDIQELTIRNIYDPLNDERILRANRPDIGHPLYRFTSRIFASRLLWPNEPSEADMLLLIPVLIKLHNRCDTDIILQLIPRYGTLLQFATARNYLRVIQLLLQVPLCGCDRAWDTGILLEAAMGSVDTIKLLLNSGYKIKVSESARQRASEDAEKNRLLQEYERKGFQKRSANYGLVSASGTNLPVTIPVPDDILAKYAKKHADFMTAAKKRGDNIPTEPHHRGIKPFVAWAISVPAVAVALKYAHDLYQKYYGTEKKRAQAQG